MDIDTAKVEIIKQWDEYRSDPMTTITPGSFFRWLRETHPRLLDFESQHSPFEQVKIWLAET